jgi:hypothetical protein
MVRRNLPVFEIIGDVLLLPEYEEARRAHDAELANEHTEMSMEDVYNSLQTKQSDWRTALRKHVTDSTGWVRPVTPAPGTYWEDNSHKLSEEFLQNFFNEVQGIMAQPGANVRIFKLGEDGELIEQE